MLERLRGWLDQNVRVAHAALITVLVVLQILTPGIIDAVLDIGALALVWRLTRNG